LNSNTEKVHSENLVEDIVNRYPAVVGFLRERGIICIQCGEPAWGSIGDLIAEKGMDVEAVMNELNEFLLKTS